MVIVLHNLKQEPDAPGHYIGRARRDEPHNPLGNPFLLGRDGDRDEVCNKFDRKMWDLVRRAVSKGCHVTEDERLILMKLSELWHILRREKELHLLCFCAPERCHGLTVRAVIEWLERELGPGLTESQAWAYQFYRGLQPR